MKLKVVSPIFGFEELKEFLFEDIDDYFASISFDDITFTLIKADKVRDYKISLDEAYLELLELEDSSSLGVYASVILQDPIEKSLINFAAPIIINHDKNLLAQIALDSQKYKDYGLAEPISKYLEEKA